MRGIEGLEVDDARGVVGFHVAGRLAVVDREDFERLGRLAPGARWLALDSSRGRLKVPGLRLVDGRRVVAARLIVGAGPFERVSHRNGQAFDIRRGNLLVSSGAARVSRAPLRGFHKADAPVTRRHLPETQDAADHRTTPHTAEGASGLLT